MMLAQAFGRGAGVLVRGADDIVAWLTAACTFLALRLHLSHGELVRVGLWIDMLPAPAAHRRARRPRRHRALRPLHGLGNLALRLRELAVQGARAGADRDPDLDPQLSLVIGSGIFLVAVLDELFWS